MLKLWKMKNQKEKQKLKLSNISLIKDIKKGGTEMFRLFCFIIFCFMNKKIIV